MLTVMSLTILCTVFLVYLFCQCIRPKKYPVGPLWLPFIGNSLQIKKLSRTFGGMHLAFIELTKKYKSEIVAVKLGNEHMVCVHSYHILKQVFTSEQYVGRPDNFFWRSRCMGTRKGITGTDGEIWKEQRSFLVSHLKALGFGKTKMEEMVKDEIRDIIETIEKNPSGIDLGKALAPAILNILWILTSGNNLKGNERLDKLLQLLSERTKIFDISGGTLNQFPWLRYVAPEKSGYNLIVKINSEIKSFIMEFVDEHKNNWTEGRCDDVIYSFLSEMKRQEGKPNYFSDDQLVMVCLDIFLAGANTTSDTINFAFYAMILYPEVQERVYQCLEKEFHADKDISYSDRHRVPYVEAVLLECQRVFPILPFAGPRRVIESTELGDYIIPKDTSILLNLHSVHYDKDYWKDPKIFRPERFLDQNGKLTCQDRILTFGLGKRRCLGDTLAKACIFLFFAKILRKFKIELTDGHEKLTGKPVLGITFKPEKYRAKFITRII